MSQFEVVKNITLPLFKITEQPGYYRFDDAIHIGKEIAANRAAQKEPPHLARVTNMETGEQGEIILGAVLLKELTENYPNDAYVSKVFLIQKVGVKEGTGGKRYNTYKLAEVRAAKPAKESAK